MTSATMQSGARPRSCAGEPAMLPLDRKPLRDLWRLKGQAVASAVLMAGGVMTLILSVTTLETLSGARDRFYASHHFAEVFADVKRAPLGVVSRLEEIEGVNLVAPQVQASLRLSLPGFDDPIRGLAQSIPDGRQPTLNRLYLVAGGLPEPEI